MKDNVLNRVPFVRCIQENTYNLGLALSLIEAFADANIFLDLKGDVSLWAGEGVPVIMIGDHRSGLEQVPLMAAFGLLGRNDLYTVAVPHSIARRMLKVFDQTGTEHELPVLPRLLAKDRAFSFNEYTLTRMVHARSLLSTQETVEMNEATFDEAGGLLQEGHAINIFPAGHVKRDIRERWPRGVGEIVSRLDPHTRRKLIVVPYRFEDDYSSKGLMESFALRSIGMQPKKRTFTIDFGAQLSAHDLLGDETRPQAIADIFNNYYMQSINPPQRR